MKNILIAILIALLSFNVHAEQIKVGAIFPLSGAVAPWGERLQVGLETVNALLGNKFEIIYEDEGACEALKAITAYRKLRTKKDLKIILLGCLSGTEAIAPVAAKESVLLLSLGLLNESTLSSGAKLVDLATEIGVEGKFLAKYIRRENPKKIAGMFFADAFGLEFSRTLSKELENIGGFVALDEAVANIETFKPFILRWKRLGIDLLITTLAEKQQLTLIKEMKELAFQPKVFSTYVLESVGSSDATRKKYEDIMYTHPVNNAERKEETLKLKKELAKRERDDRKANINAFFAYDGMRFLLQGIDRCTGVKPECLYQFFTGLGERSGVSGEMRFEKSGALTRPYGLKIVKNGEFEWLERASLKDLS